MYKFCIIEKNEKTFLHFKKYMEENNKNCYDIDNKIQFDEIKYHLKGDLENAEEKLNWVEENGNKMRIYLNTIKLLSIMAKTIKVSGDWDSFCALADQLNSLKDKYLDSIF